MTTIVTRAGLGSPLPSATVDANFTNLNTDKLELGGTFSSGTANSLLFLNASKVASSGTSVGSDVAFNGVTVGRGAGAVSTNTAVGASALAANTSGTNNAAFGISALAANTSALYGTALGAYALASNTTGNSNTGVGYGSLNVNTTGASNTALGFGSLQANTTASNNTAVGYQAGYSGTTAPGVTFLGYQAGYSATTGAYNCFVGLQAGYYVTTGTRNTILGGYNGNQGGLDIRTASNYIVLSDGDGNPRVYHDGSQLVVDKPLTTGLTKRTVFSFNRQTEYFNGIRLRTPLGYANDGFYQVTLRGYHYRKGASADLTVCWYGYSTVGYPISVSVTTSGGWSPTVYLKNNGSGGTDIYFGIDDSDGYYLFGDVDVTSISAIPTSGWSVDDTAYTSGGVDVPYVQQIGKAASQVGQGADARLYVTKGITFPATQNASSDANTLDDYEEGTWTPTFVDVTYTASATYTEGRYTKIGRVVTVVGVITTDSLDTGDASQVDIGGLPFTVENVNVSYTPATLFIEEGFNASGIDGYQAICVPGSTIIRFYTFTKQTSGNNYGSLLYNQLTDGSLGTRVRFQLTYIV